MSLDRITATRTAKAQAEADYRDAILTAKDDGASVPEIAKAAGITRSAVYQILEGERKRRETDEARMAERLAELDRRWDTMIDQIAETFMPANPRAEQAIRNGHNARAKRTLAGVRRDGRASGSVGRHRSILPTVRREARNLAESKVLRMLQDRPDEPLVQRIVAELDEAAALRQTLEALRDTRAFGSPV